MYIVSRLAPLARLIFLVAIGMAVSLIFVAFRANAQIFEPDRSKPVTASGTADQPLPKIQPKTISSAPPGMPNILVYENAEVDETYRAGVDENGNPTKPKQYLYSDPREADGLDVDLAQSASGYKTVVLEGPAKSGRGTLVAKLILTRPHSVFRIDIDKYEAVRNGPDGETKALEQLQSSLQWLRQQARNNKNPQIKYILHIDNFAVLKRGNLNAANLLVESMADTTGFYTIIEATPKSLDNVEGLSTKFSEIKDSFRVRKVMGATYENMVAHLLAHQNEMPRPVDYMAIKAIARIKTRFLKTQGYEAGMQLLQLAEQEAQADASGSNQTERLSLQSKIEALQNEVSSLSSSLERASDDATKAKLQQELDQQNLALDRAKSSLEKTSDGIDLRYELADVTAKRAMAIQEENDLRDKLSAYNKVVDYVQGGPLAAAKQRVKDLSQQKVELETEIKQQGTGATITENHVLRAASKYLNVSQKKLTSSFAEGLATWSNFEKLIKGQKHVLAQIKNDITVRAVHLNSGKAIDTPEYAEKVRLGIEEDAIRPVGSYWFAGPSGAGKTFTAEELGHQLGYEVKVFNMSEFTQAHYIAALIGSPPGYAQADQPGKLTGAVREVPYTVVVLDEIEKADPKLWDILLQVVGQGTLSDNFGPVSFKNTFVIVTSNLAQGVGRMTEAQLYDKLAQIRMRQKVQDSDLQFAEQFKKKKMTAEEMRQQAMDARIKMYQESEDGQLVMRTSTNPQTGEFDINLLKSETYYAIITDDIEMKAMGYPGKIREEIAGRFRGKFLLFDPITKETGDAIFRDYVKDITLSTKNLYGIDVVLTEDVMKAMTDRLDPRNGARNIQVAVEQLLSLPLANLIYPKKVPIQAGYTIVLDVSQDGRSINTFTLSKEQMEKINVEVTAAKASGESVVDTESWDKQVDASAAHDHAPAKPIGELVKSAKSSILDHLTTDRIRKFVYGRE